LSTSSTEIGVEVVIDDIAGKGRELGVWIGAAFVVLM
jgi:hypothetical protein